MDKTQYRVGIILGVLLIAAGLFFLLAQIFNIDTSGLLWPWIIVFFGGAFFIGMLLGGKQAGPLAVPGSIIITIGLILFIQNTFDLWLSWAYSWGLIVCSVGIGMVIYGRWSDIADLRTKGWEVARVGLILFLVFGAIFNLIFGILGVTESDNMFWPVVLMALGVFLLIFRSIRLVQGKAKGDDRDLFWPVIFFGVGLGWLLMNLGLLMIDNWTSLIPWWPLLLIAVGVDLLAGRRYPWVGAILGGAMVAGVLYLLYAG
jgi:hypothetical protein